MPMPPSAFPGWFVTLHISYMMQRKPCTGVGSSRALLRGAVAVGGFGAGLPLGLGSSCSQHRSIQSRIHPNVAARGSLAPNAVPYSLAQQVQSEQEGAGMGPSQHLKAQGRNHPLALLQLGFKGTA